MAYLRSKTSLSVLEMEEGWSHGVLLCFFFFHLYLAGQILLPKMYVNVSVSFSLY